MGLLPHGHGGLHRREEANPTLPPCPYLCPLEARAPGSSEKGLTLTAPSQESAWGEGRGSSADTISCERKPQLLCPEVPGRALPSQPPSRYISHPEATEVPELTPELPHPFPRPLIRCPRHSPGRRVDKPGRPVLTLELGRGRGPRVPGTSAVTSASAPQQGQPAPGEDSARSAPHQLGRGASASWFPPPFQRPSRPPPFQMLPFHSDHFISKATNCLKL